MSDCFSNLICLKIVERCTFKIYYSLASISDRVLIDWQLEASRILSNSNQKNIKLSAYKCTDSPSILIVNAIWYADQDPVLEKLQSTKTLEQMILSCLESSSNGIWFEK